MAYKVFTNGSTLPASDLNDYLMKQAVISFADSAARSGAIPSPNEGMLTWLEDSNRYEYYNGSSWTALTESSLTTETANYTTVATNAGNTVVINSASNLTVTISNTLNVGQRIDFIRRGTGTVTFAAGAGVTLNSKSGNLKLTSQYSAGTVICVASGVYILIGDLSA